MRKFLYIFISLCSILLFAGISAAKISSTVHVWPVPVNEMNHLNKVLQDSRSRKWQSAILSTFQPSDPVIKKILQWNLYASGSPALNFKDVTQFINDNPYWPEQEILMNNAENVINDTTDPDDVIAWFSLSPPLAMQELKFRRPTTANGKRRLADALIRLYKKYNFDHNLIPTLIKEAWIEGNYSSEEEQKFLTVYKPILDKDAIERRLDRLLSDRRINDANRLSRYVDADYKKLYEARIAFIGGKRNVETVINTVPASLRNNPGLIYDRIKWRIDHNIDDGITELLQQLPSKLDYPEKLYGVRKAAIKELISHRKYRDAYLMAKNHGFRENTEKLAEFEWQAGWLALRFLHDPDAAYDHFHNVYDVAKTPITLARAAYWLGRASEVLRNGEESKWYGEAAAYPVVFYGQLAALKLNDRAPDFPSPSVITKKDLVNYRGNELAKAAYIMWQIKENRLAKEFLKAAAAAAKTPGERVLVAQMGLDRDRYDYSLHVAKDIYKVSGEVVMNALFPVFNLLSVSGKQIATPPSEYTLAIIRQESEFDTTAISPAGARGLMQLMPATAQMYAKKLGLPFNKNRLSGDPRYNITIGAAYLQSRLQLYDGSYLLATASYNAGEGNIRKWINAFGDPRNMDLENAVDWIELIPFPETNNYVQRVIENMQIYRIAISGKRYNDINTDRDLTR